MKVLMLGWEFPPHISGGLGTACFGLTKALMKEHVEVLFVVPKVFGDEAGSKDFLINASTVTGATTSHVRGRSYPPHVQSSTSAGEGSSTIHGRRPIAYVEVPSALTPYQREPQMMPRSPKTIDTWNYSFDPGSAGKSEATRDTEEVTFDRPPGSEPFEFSGTYGENLIDEVRRYADVAELLARRHTFDVIHVHDWMTFLAGVAAKKESQKPLVVHVHSTEFDRSGGLVNREVVELERMGLQEADKIVAVSRLTKEILVSHYKIPEEKIAVVHNGVLPKGRSNEFSFPAIASHFVTFLGRVTHQKGPGYFVDASQMVLKEFPDAHFIIAGAGDLLPQIIERVAQLNISANFHFTGFLSGDQVDRIWSLTDVYVMPSVSEPFGIAPLEAIQGGVPVILSKQSGVAEVMPHAIKVDFWDTRALAAAICSILRYESLSTVLRQKSKQHLKRLTWEKAARQVKRLYHELSAQ